MAFYDSVKNKVRNDGNDDVKEKESGKEEKGDGKVAFDQLIEDSKDRKRDLEPEDEDSIEDFTGNNRSSGGDYGDLSKIEMSDNGSPQAGKEDKPSGNSKSGKSGRSVRKKVSAEEDSEEEVMLTAGGEVKSPKEESAEEAGSTEKALLRQIRDQNREIVKLLRSIDSKMD